MGMFGFIGFFVAAIVIATYVTLLPKFYKNVSSDITKGVASGFGYLAFTMIVWMGATVLMMEGKNLTAWLIAADILLIAGSVRMLRVVIDEHRLFLLPHIVWFIGVILIVLRLTVFPSFAFIQDGILYFKLENIEIGIIAVIFGALWLPACLKLVFAIRKAYPKEQLLTGATQVTFYLLIVASGLFLASQRLITIILSFVSVIALFMGLIMFGWLHRQLIKQQSGGNKHAK